MGQSRPAAPHGRRSLGAAIGRRFCVVVPRHRAGRLHPPGGHGGSLAWRLRGSRVAARPQGTESGRQDKPGSEQGQQGTAGLRGKTATAGQMALRARHSPHPGTAPDRRGCAGRRGQGGRSVAGQARQSDRPELVGSRRHAEPATRGNSGRPGTAGQELIRDP